MFKRLIWVIRDFLLLCPNCGSKPLQTGYRHHPLTCIKCKFTYDSETGEWNEA